MNIALTVIAIASLFLSLVGTCLNLYMLAVAIRRKETAIRTGRLLNPELQVAIIRAIRVEAICLAMQVSVIVAAAMGVISAFYANDTHEIIVLAQFVASALARIAITLLAGSLTLFDYLDRERLHRMYNQDHVATQLNYLKSRHVDVADIEAQIKARQAKPKPPHPIL